MKRFIKDKVYHIVYEDLNEFFALTDPKNPSKDMHSRNAHQLKDLGSDSSWRYGDEKNKENFYVQRFSPTKGKSLCADAVKKTMADKSYKKLITQALTYKKRIKYEDVGNRISVAKAIAGEDKYFARFTNSKKPTVKICINICGSASVNQQAFIDIAKTAIPTIYALETAGLSTEVYYCAFARGTHDEAAEYTATHVKIKSSQQRFNWTTFAPVFCLGSYRESVFASWINSEHNVDGGLGQPMNDSAIKKFNNFDYAAVIGLNAVGPVETVNEIFKSLGKTTGS